MKTVLILSLFVFSAFQAAACPNLTGTYDCSPPDDIHHIVTITQSVQSGITTYNFDYGSGVVGEFIADNVTRVLPDTIVTETSWLTF
jgi:hypothetical protein